MWAYDSPDKCGVMILLCIDKKKGVYEQNILQKNIENRLHLVCVVYAKCKQDK